MDHCKIYCIFTKNYQQCFNDKIMLFTTIKTPLQFSRVSNFEKYIITKIEKYIIIEKYITLQWWVTSHRWSLKKSLKLFWTYLKPYLKVKRHSLINIHFVTVSLSNRVLPLPAQPASFERASVFDWLIGDEAIVTSPTTGLQLTTSSSSDY